jgi:hypothetical protein
MSDLSNTVLTATKNLETVSTKLKDVIENLSTSMDMNFSMQREMLSASLLNSTLNTNMNTSRGGWERGADGTPAAQSDPGRSWRGIQGTPSATPLGAGSSALRYRDLSSSPESVDRRPNGESHRHETGHRAVPKQAAATVDAGTDAALTLLVRERMEIKLRKMLEV